MTKTVFTLLLGATLNEVRPDVNWLLLLTFLFEFWYSIRCNNQVPVIQRII